MRFALLLIIAFVTGAQSSVAGAQSIDAALVQIQSADANIRMEGFYTIAENASASQVASDPVRSGLVNLLILENGIFRTSAEPDGPAFGDYFSELFTFVASIGDTRTIPVLVSNIDTGGTATDALGSFGASALDGVISQLSSPDPSVRNGSVHAIQTMILKGTAADAPSAAKIRSALDSASLDSYPNVRRNAIVGLATVFGQRIESTPQLINIDIKPGESPNAINPRSNGVIPVAVLSTKTFDARSIDPTTIKFGPGQTGPRNRVHVEDVNRDGLPDIVLQFATRASQIACSDTGSFLVATTTAGQVVVGSDSIRTVGCKRRGAHMDGDGDDEKESQGGGKGERGGGDDSGREDARGAR